MQKTVIAALTVTLLGVTGVFLGCEREEPPAVPERPPEQREAPGEFTPPAPEEQEGEQEEQDKGATEPLPMPGE